MYASVYVSIHTSLPSKKTNFELGVRVPFIIRAPWIPQSLGARTPVLAELLDLYPTLAELAGLEPPTNASRVGSPPPQGLALSLTLNILTLNPDNA